METVTISEDSFTHIVKKDNTEEAIELVEKIISNKIALKLLMKSIKKTDKFICLFYRFH